MLLMKQNLGMMGTKVVSEAKCVVVVLPKLGEGTAKCSTRKAKSSCRCQK